MMKKIYLIFQITFLILIAPELIAIPGNALPLSLNGFPDTSGIKSYRAPFPSRENIPVGPRYKRWVTRSEFSFASFSLMTGNDVMQADLLKLNHRIFSITGLSVINSYDPYAPLYFFPVGIKASLLNARHFNITAGADLYLFPYGDQYSGHTDFYQGDYQFGSYSDELEVRFSRFVDARISVEAVPFFGVKAFVGCRVPLTSYSIYNITAGNTPYERDSPFVYAGVSGAIQLIFPFNESVFYRCYNERDNRIRKARKSNSPTAWESIIKTYPDTPYATEASRRLEYLFYSRAVLGNITRCDEYNSRYPAGKYKKEVNARREQLIEEGAYLASMKGSVRDLNDFLTDYPNGKYSAKARAQRDKILEGIELRAYQGALTGTFDSCDVYIEKYPSGKYISEIRALREEKLGKAEENLYNDALTGSFIECDNYLRFFPQGKYSVEVNRMRAINYNASEAEYYTKAVGGSLTGCNEYILYYPSGQYVDEIKSMKKDLTDKLKIAIDNLADRYSTLLIEQLEKSDSASKRTAGYAVSVDHPFVLYVNRSEEPGGGSSLGEDKADNHPGISQRSLGRIPASFGETARLNTWDINGILVSLDNQQPVTVIIDNKGLMDVSKFKLLLETARVGTEGYITVDGLKFELAWGVITYTDLKSPGWISDGSVVIVNDTRFIKDSGVWVEQN